MVAQEIKICKECGIRLGNRNKHGCCINHVKSSIHFKLRRKQTQARFYEKLTPEQKKKLQQRTSDYKNKNKTEEQLQKLQKIRKMSSDEKRSYFKNKKVEYNKKYDLERSKVDLSFRIAKNIRSRTSKAISKNIKKGSSIKQLGISLEEFKTYIESKFYANPDTKEIMSWDNYGHKGWHIDHIKPLSLFNLQNEEEFKQACHYTNLQPLWAKDNLVKSNKYEEKI
jgi:hypothetical protein